MGESKKMNRREKTYLAIWIGILGIIAGLYCNSNNNPVPFILRIIPPYEYKNGKLFYINIIMLLVISFILVEIYKLSEWRLLNSVTKRLICTFVFVLICGEISVGAVQVYKSFQRDLKSIYLDRGEMKLEYKWKTVKDDGEIYKAYHGGVYVTLKNCSKKIEQHFKVRIIVDDELEPEIAEKLMTSEEMVLYPGETQELQVISFDGLKEKIDANETVGTNGMRSYSMFKVVLYNEDMSVIFLANE